MLKDRNSLVLYTTAICNLKCRYCYIDKNPALKTIDDLLDESFKGDYYFNYAKKVFPDKNQLTEVQIWGGEPSIRLDRCYYTIEKLIEYYPNLKDFMTSTNFTIDNWCEQFYGFLNVFKKFPNRNFVVRLQLSIDGPEYINDESRGIGVTKKFTNTFDKMIDTIDKNLPNNVFFEWFFKPTLDSGTIRLLQSEEKIIEYFQFFESFYRKSKHLIRDNFNFGYSVPNTACPSPHTKEDGILFANYCKLTRKIEKDNKEKHYFDFYTSITSFIPRHRCKIKGYACSGGICGTGKYCVGLLPNNMISTCHNGFVDLISDYKKECQKHLGENTSLDFNFFSENRKTRMTMKFEEFSEYEKQIEYFYYPETNTRIANIASLINLLARVGQIDVKYKDRKESLLAAYFIQEATSYCVRDNINTTGCTSLYPVGLLKLLLNGAKEYIEENE